MTDVRLFSDDETVELIADTIYDQTITQVAGITGRELQEEVVEEGNIRGGILEQLKNSCNKSLEKTKKEYRNKRQSGGGAVTMFAVIIKLILMTTGSFIFSYFPIVFLISSMCLYIEYKLTVVMGQSIVGLPLFYMSCACCCPCLWTFFRLFKGWTNKLNISTPGIWSLLINCSDSLSILNIYNVDGSVCKQGDCYIVSKECHNVLYPRTKEN